MQTLVQIAIFAAGLVVLYFGAEALLKGAVRLAQSFGISALIIGLTLVAFGTSAPELSLDLTAAFRGATDLAFGDLVGSNIANVGLIAGVAAVIRPPRVQMRLLKIEVPISIAAALALWGLAADKRLGRIDGAVLCAGFAGFLAVCYTSVRREPAAVKEDLKQAARADVPVIPVPANGKPAPPKDKRSWNVALVIAGLVGLVGGAQLMVSAAVSMARQLGVGELLIGLTIVAVGTSLPELATSVVGAWRDEGDIVMGNIVGSNIFNLLGIMGLVALVRPIAVHSASLRFEVPVMVALMIGLVPMMIRLRMTRIGGAVLLFVYAAFIVSQIVTAMSSS